MKKILFILTVFINTYSFSQTQREKDSTMLVNGGFCAYLDFTGASTTTQAFGSVVAAASAINGNTSAMDAVVDYTQEHYYPFNVVVTRDSTLYELADEAQRALVIITPTYQWYCGETICVGGLTSAEDHVSYVFDGLGSTDRSRLAVHELGHQLTLTHYISSGFGTGETSVVQVMDFNSALYSKNMVIWWSGTTENSTPQDDIEAITIKLKGARLSDVGSSFNTAKFLHKDQNFHAFIGVNDNDYYKIEIPSTQTVSIAVQPWNTGASNADATLDAAIDIYNIDHNLIASSANTTVLNATLSHSLTAGTYYIRVRPDTGNANNPTGYGFMGHYYLSYTF